MTFFTEYKTYLKRAGIVSMLSLILCLLAYVLVLRPQNNSKKRLERNLEEQKQTYTVAQEAATEENRIQLNEHIKRLQDQLRDFVTDSEELTDLTFDISQIANGANLTSFSVTPRVKRSGGRRGTMTEKSKNRAINENLIDIKFTAGFRQFAAFMNALERHHPVLFIDEFTITRSSQNESVYQATLDVTAFVRKQQDKETADKGLEQALSAKL
jgi:Tfp pilus assembly protein PilO